MIGTLVQAQRRSDVVAAVRALDRVLISGAYMVPLFHHSDEWVAHWTRIRHPAATSAIGLPARNLVAAAEMKRKTRPLS